MGKLKIHSENILPIIKKWLYSEKDIFVRELVSNACDAISKVKVLRDLGEAEISEDTFKIEIAIDKAKRTLTFSDTGLGMDTDEVENYIAQLAFSGAEDFVAKYRSDKEEDQIIGHFGLGFYSAYMVADTVEIQTLSYKKEATAVHWSCDGSSEYTMAEGVRSERGTDVILHLSEDAEEYLEEASIRKILESYCAYLPVPIYLNGTHLNKEEPLWIKPASECSEKEYTKFYGQLYPFEPEPLFWVHLNVDYPFHLKGVLYFPKLRRDFDFSKNSIKLFCSRVFVSDNCQDLIPEYLTALRGAIDSPDIPLNVSRSYLQMDRTVRQLATHIAKKVADRLVSLFRDEKDRFIAMWRDLEVVLKLGAMQDDKFYQRVKECLIFKSTSGEWTTVEDYLERNPGQKVFYAGEAEVQGHFLELYKERGIEVLHTHAMLDGHFISFLESKLSGVTFQRIDGGIDETILDLAKEKTVLDAEGRTEASRLADYAKEVLEVEVEAKSLASESVPAFLVLEERARRLRDTMSRSDTPGMDFLAGQSKLVLNTNSPLVTAIESLKGKSPKLAKDLLRQIHDMALLSQREMKPEALDAFVARTSQVLQELVTRAV